MEPEFKVRRKQVFSAWEVYRKKYKLPKLEELELRYRFIANDPFLIVETVMGHMSSFYSNLSDLLESILNPHRMFSMMESKAFSKDEKEKMLKLYRKLNLLSRETYLSSLKNEKEHVQTIKKSDEIYTKGIQEQITKILEKLRDYWTKDEPKSQPAEKAQKEYFG